MYLSKRKECIHLLFSLSWIEHCRPGPTAESQGVPRPAEKHSPSSVSWVFLWGSSVGILDSSEFVDWERTMKKTKSWTFYLETKAYMSNFSADISGGSRLTSMPQSAPRVWGAVFFPQIYENSFIVSYKLDLSSHSPVTRDTFFWFLTYTIGGALCALSQDLSASPSLTKLQFIIETFFLSQNILSCRTKSH